MTDSLFGKQDPVLAYRKADRDQVLSQLIQKLVERADAGQRLSTKSLTDPTVALLDGWATVADVVDFYQERIATENYLRTAVEPESVLALATLLGYLPRPGLAATCFLAYTLVPDVPDAANTARTAVQLPKGLLVQSVPGSGELPQTFETVSDLMAHPSWNKLPVKTTAPLAATAVGDGSDGRSDTPPPVMVVAGVNTLLKPNDVVLLGRSTSQDQATSAKFIVARVQRAEVDLAAQTTRIDLQRSAVAPPPVERSAPPPLEPQPVPPPPPPAQPPRARGPKGPKSDEPSKILGERLDQLVKVLPRGKQDVLRTSEKYAGSDPGKGFKVMALSMNEPELIEPLPNERELHEPEPETPQPIELSNVQVSLLAHLHPESTKGLFTALATTAVGEPYLDSVYALRGRAMPFGAQVPPRARFDSQGSPQAPEEWPIADTQTITVVTDVNSVNMHDVNRGAILEAPVSVAGPQGTGTARIDPHNPQQPVPVGGGRISLQSRGDNSDERDLVFAPDSDGLDKITLHIDRDLLVTATNARTEGPVAVSLAQALALLPVPSPVVAQSGKGLSLRVQASLLPGQEGKARVVIEVVSALPVKDRTVLELSEPRTEILPGSYVAIDKAGPVNPPPSPGNAAAVQADDEPSYPVVAKVNSADPVSVSRYGTTMSVTRLALDTNWVGAKARLLSDIRSVTVFVESEPLEAQPVPITASVASDEIEISGLLPGIETGRCLLITGVRDDLDGAAVDDGEVIKVAAVTQVYGPGEQPYTTLSLVEPLKYSYRRDSVKLYGNVVEARQGVPVTEEKLTAAGDIRNPTLTLAQSPVLADPSGTGSGYESSLELVIDGRVWNCVPRIDGRTPSRCYMTGTDGKGRTVITLSQPLPHPASRIVATYRTGDGAAGNVRAGQLTQLLTRPLAVSDVTNPLAASGGSRPDGADTVRADAPRGLQSLGRVVSAQDAADIALTWAGVGKSQAVLTSWCGRETLIVTVAGTEPTPLREDSKLIHALEASLVAAGDVTVPIHVEPAPISLITMRARVLLASDFTWDSVERAVRAQLVDEFGYNRRKIGQDVIVSDMISVIHRVEGVRSCSIAGVGLVDAAAAPSELVAFGPLPPPPGGRISLGTRAAPERIPRERRIPPGVAFLSGTVTDIVIIEEERR